MRRIFLCKKKGSATIDFALNELAKYIKMMDKEILIDQATVTSFEEKTEIMLYVGLLTEAKSPDDREFINIWNIWDAVGTVPVMTENSSRKRHFLRRIYPLFMSIFLPTIIEACALKEVLIIR